MRYECRFLGSGTGSASDHLTPMLSAWATGQGKTIYPGTLNLCAVEPLLLPSAFHSLEAFGHLASPAWRQAQMGFSPRLYDIILNGDEKGWLYRWSAPEHLRTFVGFAEGCQPEHRAEVVAQRHLTSAFGLRPGANLTLEFA